MLMIDKYLFNAGWLFFAAWMIVVIVVSVKAFGQDLLSLRKDAESVPNLQRRQARSR